MTWLRPLCCFLLGCTLSALPAAAQSTADTAVYETVVYLHDGSIVRGELLRRNRGGGLMLHLANGMLVTYEGSEIERVATEAVSATAMTRTPRPARPARPPVSVAPPRITSLAVPGGRPGRKLNLRVGLHTLSGSAKTAGFNLAVGLHAEVLTPLGEDFLVGLGLGWDLYAPSVGEEVYPLYLAAKYYPTGFGRPAYLFGSVGYGLATKDRLLEVREAKGGLYLHGGIGVPVFSASGHRLALEVGFVTQEAEFGRINFNDDYEFRDLQYRRITLGVRAYILRSKAR